jgi:hypothetical protein
MERGTGFGESGYQAWQGLKAQVDLKPLRHD